MEKFVGMIFLGLGLVYLFKLRYLIILGRFIYIDLLDNKLNMNKVQNV